MTRIGVRALAVVVAAQLLTGCVVAAGSSNDGVGRIVLLPVTPFALVLLMAALARRRLRPARGRAGSFTGHDDTTNEQVLRAELSVLADDVIRLEPHVVLNEKSRDDYEAATHRYRVAQAALDDAKEPVDLVRVQRVVDEANWSMARARAILDGRQPPEPPPPLQRPGTHGEPAVGVDDGHQPVYVDSPDAFRSGWFSAGGGLFGGLLLGSMVGGFGGGWVAEQHVDDLDQADPDVTENVMSSPSSWSDWTCSPRSLEAHGAAPDVVRRLGGGQPSNTDQQISLRSRWSASTSSRIESGSCSRCHRHPPGWLGRHVLVGRRQLPPRSQRRPPRARAQRRGRPRRPAHPRMRRAGRAARACTRCGHGDVAAGPRSYSFEGIARALVSGCSASTRWSTCSAHEAAHNASDRWSASVDEPPRRSVTNRGHAASAGSRRHGRAKRPSDWHSPMGHNERTPS